MLITIPVYVHNIKLATNLFLKYNIIMLYFTLHTYPCVHCKKKKKKKFPYIVVSGIYYSYNYNSSILLQSNIIL